MFARFQKENAAVSALITVFITCLLSGVVVAEEALSIYVDNDSRFTKPNGNTDRHYTNGGKIVYTAQPDWQWLEDFSTWHFGQPGQDVDKAVGFFLGQNIYTPDHADDPARRDPRDRVFAGWLYTGLFAQRATADALDHAEINVGVIGPSAHGEEIQNGIHALIHSAESVGWDEQLDDEFAIDLVFMRQQRLTFGPLQPAEHTDFIGEYGFTVGSVHRHAQAGLTFRYGRNLAGTFNPGRMTLPSAISRFRQKDTAYLFVREAVRAVEHNRFMTGLDHEPVVGELQAGFVYQKGRFELGYSQTFLTREFEQQNGKDSFGTFTVSMLF